MLETRVLLFSQPEPPVGAGKAGMCHHTVFEPQEQGNAAVILASRVERQLKIALGLHRAFGSNCEFITTEQTGIKTKTPAVVFFKCLFEEMLTMTRLSEFRQV